MTAPFQGVEADEIEFPAGKIRFYRAGTTGPAIVLLHGGGLDNAMLSWRHCIPVLAADHRVYAPDLPGQGGSVPWHGRANQRTLEEALRWLLDAWELTDTALVGLSLGGSVATGFTLRHPRRVRGLVLVDSAGLRHRLNHHLRSYALVRTRAAGILLNRLVRLNRSMARHMLARTVFAGSREVPELDTIVDEVRAEARSRGSVFTEWQQESIGRRSMVVNHLPHLERIDCPTMLVHGARDPLVPLAASQQAADAISGADLRVLPDAGHWPHRQRPTEFHALLREFVNAQS